MRFLIPCRASRSRLPSLNARRGPAAPAAHLAGEAWPRRPVSAVIGADCKSASQARLRRRRRCCHERPRRLVTDTIRRLSPGSSKATAASSVHAGEADLARREPGVRGQACPASRNGTWRARRAGAGRKPRVNGHRAVRRVRYTEPKTAPRQSLYFRQIIPRRVSGTRRYRISITARLGCGLPRCDPCGELCALRGESGRTMD